MLGLPPYLNPKNILLTLLGIALISTGFLYLTQRTTLATTKANLESCQKDLSIEKIDLADCEKNVAAVKTQYEQAEQTNANTNTVRDKIWTIVNKHTVTAPGPAQTNPQIVTAAPAAQPKEMVIDNETQKKLDDLFAVANSTVVAFNTRVRASAGVGGSK